MIHIDCGHIIFSYGSESALREDLIARMRRIDALESSTLEHAPAELLRQRERLDLLLSVVPVPEPMRGTWA